MKTALQTALSAIAPSICIQTIWEHDPNSGPISKECDGFDASEDENWQAWQSEIRAIAVVDGEEIAGSAYLGGTFEKWDNNPAESNPDISGYEPQMTLEALEELRAQLPTGFLLLGDQIGKACGYLRQFMTDERAKHRVEAAKP